MFTVLLALFLVAVMPEGYDISVFLGYIFGKVRNSKHHKNVNY